MRLQRLLASAGAAALVLVPLACGDGGEPRPDLVLVSTRDGEYAIYALDADGSKQKRLTPADVDPTTPARLLFQLEPAWSPDGAGIAFTSNRRGNSDVFLMDADGTATRALTSDRADESHPTWSADGRRVAFQRGDSGDIYVVGSDGSGLSEVVATPAAETQPAWSPDGEWIAYVRRTPGTEIRELWLVRPDGTRAHALTRFARASIGPAWSPDSERIAFAANLDGEVLDIYSIRVDGSSLRRHTQSPDDAFEPAWSPDGRTIAFSRAGAIVTVELGGNVETITDPENNDSSPAWNPRPPGGEED